MCNETGPNVAPPRVQLCQDTGVADIPSNTDEQIMMEASKLIANLLGQLAEAHNERMQDRAMILNQQEEIAVLKQQLGATGDTIERLQDSCIENAKLRAEVGQLRAELPAGMGALKLVRKEVEAQEDETTLDATRRLKAENSQLREACEEGAMLDDVREETFPDTLERIGRGTDWEDYCIGKAEQIRAAITKTQA